MTDILERIVARKRDHIALRREQVSSDVIDEMMAAASAPRGFVAALEARMHEQRAAVIAEIKKASPSKGVIREQFSPAVIATDYEQCGAACLSVLTDEPFFQGHDDYLDEARNASALPALRKDFMIDAWQIDESRALGADCILLIVSILDDATLKALYKQSVALGMDVLIEVHDRAELERALALSPSLVGINNRDLRTFETDLETTLSLMEMVPADCRIVTESGIHSPEDVERMTAAGIYGFLVGEAFMRAESPGEKLASLFGQFA